MDFASFGDNITSNISQAFGNIEKAILMIEPAPSKTDGVQNYPAMKPSSSGFLADHQGESFWSSVGDALKGAGSAVASAAGSAIGIDGDEFRDMFGLDKGEKKPNVFYVQFNPSTVTFSATGTMPEKMDRTATPSQSGKPPRRSKTKVFLDAKDVSITMGMDLIFEDVDNEDAFLENKLSPVNGEFAQSLAKSAVKAAGLSKKNHSVRDVVQALNYIARTPEVGLLSFFWGQTAFKGMLHSFRAEYTMFSPKGEPIFAKAHLDLVLLSGRGAVEEWDKIYEDSFGQGTGHLKAKDYGVMGDTSGVSSIINIPI